VCNKAFEPDSAFRVCSPECQRKRASEYVLRRYHNDPEYRDLVISLALNRRASLLGLDGITQPSHLLDYLMARDDGICGICQEPVTELDGPMRPSPDHIIPLSRGGRHEIGNLQLSHLGCNYRKGASALLAWRQTTVTRASVTPR
jgi:hypothetical protein